MRVAGPSDEIAADMRRFTLALTTTFSLLGLSLGLTTLLQIRFGLAPLIKLRAALGAIRRARPTASRASTRRTSRRSPAR